MKKRLVIALVVVLALAATASVVWAKGGGFDVYGYNYTARLFNGLLGNADRDADPGTFWGSATDDTPIIDCATGAVTSYSVPVPGTQLVMKWSKAWDNAVFGPDGIRNSGDELPWTSKAWCTNHDTWRDAAGGHHAFYNIVYVGDGGNFTLWGTDPASVEPYCTGVFNITVQVFK